MYELPNNPTVLRELTSLHDKLNSKRATVESVLSDISFLKQIEKLFSVYQAEINLLTDMVQQQTNLMQFYSKSTKKSSEKDDVEASTASKIRSQDEHIASFSKACRQEIEVEKEFEMLLSLKGEKDKDNLLTAATQGAGLDMTVGSPEAKRRKQPPATSNPLLLVLRNVF